MLTITDNTNQPKELTLPVITQKGKEYYMYVKDSTKISPKPIRCIRLSYGFICDNVIIDDIGALRKYIASEGEIIVDAELIIKR